MESKNLFTNCKYCGDDLSEMPTFMRHVGVCDACEQALFAPKDKRKPKKKATYKFGD